MAYVRGLPYGGHNGPPFYFEGKYYYPQTCFELKESFIKEYKQKYGKTLWPYMAYASKPGNNVYLTAPINDWCSFPDKEEFTADKLLEMDRECRLRGPNGLKYLDCFSIPFWQLSSVIKRITCPYEVPEEDLKKRDEFIEAYLDEDNIIEPYRGPKLIDGIFILVLLGSMVFKQFYLLWPFLAIGYYFIRKAIVGK